MDFEQGSDSDADFNANELLNFTNYQQKRHDNKDQGSSTVNENQQLAAFLKSKKLSIQDVFDEQKKAELNEEGESDEDGDGWGDEDWGSNPI